MKVEADAKAYDDINITPMLDLAYVLLVIFIIMTTASVQGIKVDLPKASDTPSLAKPKTKAITISNDGKIFLDTIAMSEQGYMKYRTVHVYPQANAQINQAVSRVISGQMKAKESFAMAQANAIADLKRAGVKL